MQGYKPSTLHAAFAEVARVRPDDLAVVSTRGDLTYRALQRRAGQIAHALRGYGVTRQTPVVLALPRSLEAVTAVLGILQAGGAYVPMDPAYPAERQRLIIEEVEAPVAICAGRSSPRPGWLAGISTLLDLDELPADAPEAPADVARSSPWDLLYILYTSGSTGRPKGVCGTHAATLNRLRWGWAAYPPAADEVIAHRASLGFVDSVVEIFSGLLSGHRLALLLPEETAELGSFIAALKRHQVTQITVVPSLLAALLRTQPDLGQALKRVRLWISSGEELPLPLLRLFRAAHPAATLLNLYGSTEVTGDVTCAAFPPTAPLPEARTPLGRAIAGAELLVLDDELRPVPAGEVGELYVGGAVLARGYYKHPEEEARRFLPHPQRAGARIYRTGDLVQQGPSGELFFCGRSDNQVKLRGVRIELEEIERTLLEVCPACSAAAVVLHTPQETQASPRLIAWVTPPELDLAVLRTRAAERLPPSMMPAQFVAIDRLPLSPTGKVDRRALRIPTAAEDAQLEQRPRSWSEQRLAALWMQVLGCAPRSLEDTFAGLGGDSLALAELIAALEGETGAAPLDAGFLREGTLAEVARWLDTRAGGLRVPLSLPEVCPLQEVQIEEVMQLVTQTFLAREPLALAARIAEADMKLFLYRMLAACQPLPASFLARDPGSRKLVGFCLAHDLVDEPTFAGGAEPPSMRPVLALLGELMQEYELARGKPRPGEAIELAMTGVALGQDGYQIAHLLEQTALGAARRLGFRRAVTICTHRVTTLLAQRAGFQRVAARNYAALRPSQWPGLACVPAQHREAILFDLRL